MKKPNLTQKVYNNFRQFVKEDEVLNYDNEFFSVKRHSYNFMYELLDKYTDINSLKSNPSTPIETLQLWGRLENKSKIVKSKKIAEINKAKHILLFLCPTLNKNQNASVAELVDALDSKSSSFGSVGSIPTRGTKKTCLLTGFFYFNRLILLHLWITAFFGQKGITYNSMRIFF